MRLVPISDIPVGVPFKQTRITGCACAYIKTNQQMYQGTYGTWFYPTERITVCTACAEGGTFVGSPNGHQPHTEVVVDDLAIELEAAFGQR